MEFKFQTSVFEIDFFIALYLESVALHEARQRCGYAVKLAVVN